MSSAAVRALKTPSNEEIEEIIDKIIKDRLNDGQFSDCPLTLKDLKVIAITFNRILRGMQHNRIKYQQTIINELDNQKVQSAFMDSELEAKIQAQANQQQAIAQQHQPQTPKYNLADAIDDLETDFNSVDEEEAIEKIKNWIEST